MISDCADHLIVTMVILVFLLELSLFRYLCPTGRNDVTRESAHAHHCLRRDGAKAALVVFVPPIMDIQHQHPQRGTHEIESK